MAETSASFMRRGLAFRIAGFEGPGPSSLTAPALCRLGRCVVEALGAVPTLAEASRIQLRDMRAALHGAIDARCDELGASVSAAEASKVELLERELLTVEAALERLRSICDTVRLAVAALSDADLTEQHAALSYCLDELDEELAALPTAVVEPAHVGLSADLSELMAELSGFGRVVAPLSITAADLTLEGVPRAVRPGNTLRLRLSLGARHAGQSAEDLDVSLDVKMAAVRVSLEGSGVAPHPLQATLSSDSDEGCLRISLAIPPTSRVGAYIHIIRVTVAGLLVAGCPVTIPVRWGIGAPLRPTFFVNINALNPCISPEGMLYVPPGLGTSVRIFDEEGVPVRSRALFVADIGLTECTPWSTFDHGGAGPRSILLADSNNTHGDADAGNDTSSSLVCVNAVSHALRWRISLLACHGIAVLPQHEVLLVNSRSLDAWGSLRPPPL